MSTSSRLRPLLVGALLLGAAAGQAFAATVTYTATSNKSTSSPTDWYDGTLIVPKFSTTLGTLTSINITLASRFSTTITFTNNGAEACSGTVGSRMSIAVVNGAAGISGTFIPTFYVPDHAFTNLASGANSTSGLLTSQVTQQSNDYSGAAQLSAFTGTGNITLTDTTTTDTVITYQSSGNVGAHQTSNAYLTGSVTYTYNVPEPACLGALAAGLCLTLRRRRQ